MNDVLRLSFRLKGKETQLWDQANRKYEEENGGEPDTKKDVLEEALEVYIQADSETIERAKVLDTLETVLDTLGGLEDEDYDIDVLGIFKEALNGGREGE